MPRVKTFTNGGKLFPGDLNSIEDYVDNSDVALATAAGVTRDGIVRGGRTAIATAQARASAAYATLTTPDVVAGVVVPAGGLLFVCYQATWQESVAGAARAAIFLGANQLVLADAEGSSVAPRAAAAATTSNTVNVDVPVSSFPGGLCSVGTASISGYTGDVTTGQALGLAGANGVGFEVNGSVRTLEAYHPAGGICVVHKLPAGTYDVSVQFKATSGTVTAKDRELLVWTRGF